MKIRNWSIKSRILSRYMYGLRTYDEDTQVTHVLYMPFVDMALEIYK